MPLVHFPLLAATARPRRRCAAVSPVRLDWLGTERLPRLAFWAAYISLSFPMGTTSAVLDGWRLERDLRPLRLVGRRISDVRSRSR